MLHNNSYEIKCDVHNCTNNAEYSFDIKGRLAKFYICKTCLAVLAEDYRKATVPKSIKNCIKKVIDNNSALITANEVQ